MAGLRAKLASTGRDLFQPTSPLLAEHSRTPKSHPTISSPLQANADTLSIPSSISSAPKQGLVPVQSRELRFIDMLRHENSELQSIISMQDTYIKTLLTQLRHHNIEPEAWPLPQALQKKEITNSSLTTASTPLLTTSSYASSKPTPIKRTSIALTTSGDDPRSLASPISTTFSDNVDRGRHYDNKNDKNERSDKNGRSDKNDKNDGNERIETVGRNDGNVFNSPSEHSQDGRTPESLSTPTMSGGLKLSKKNRFDPKGGIHLSAATASAMSAMAAISSEDGKYDSKSLSSGTPKTLPVSVNSSSSNDSLDIPERSARRRESVRIAHPALRFQERQEKERLQKEQLQKERSGREEDAKKMLEKRSLEIQQLQMNPGVKGSDTPDSFLIDEDTKLQFLRQDAFEKLMQDEEERIRRERQEILEREEQQRQLKRDQERERSEKEKIEKEKIEKEKIEKEKIEKNRIEKERLEYERIEAERLEKKRIERELLEKERLEKERLEKERLEKERVETERVETERLEKERLEKERVEKERLEKERLEKERLEILERERLERDRLEEERLEKERIENIHIQSTHANEYPSTNYSSSYQNQPSHDHESLNQTRGVESVDHHYEEKYAREAEEQRRRLEEDERFLNNMGGDVSEAERARIEAEFVAKAMADINQDQTSTYSSDESSSNTPSGQKSPEVLLTPPIPQNLQMNGNLPRIKPPPAGKIYKESVSTPTNPQGFNEYDHRIPHTPDMSRNGPGVHEQKALASPNNLSLPQAAFLPAISELSNNSAAQDIYSIDSNLTRGNASNGSFHVLNSNHSDNTTLFIKPEEFNTIRIDVLSTLFIPCLSSSHHSKKKGADEPRLTIAISDKATVKEMWRIRKTYHQLVSFDNEIRPIVEAFGLPQIPEKSLFISSTPLKVDLRKTVIQQYFETLFLMPHIPQMVLYRICKFLSLDFVNPLDDFKSGSCKEGYLIRRHKGLGSNWKVRWCQIEGSQLEIFENPGGNLIELVCLKGASVGRQSSDSVAEEKGYRHAFLLVEAQKSLKLQSSLPKHFFCAESDTERDDWIDYLIDYDSYEEEYTNYATSSRGKRLSGLSLDPYDEESTYISNEHNISGPDLSTRSNQYAINDSSTSSVHLPPGGSTATLGQDSTRSALIEDYALLREREAEREKFNERSVAQDFKDVKKSKKRSIFPFKKSNRSNSDSTSGSSPYIGLGDVMNSLPTTSPKGNDPMKNYLDSMNLDHEVTKLVFGSAVEEGFALSSHEYKGLSVPSIIYRCLDFLEKAGAIYEEGIFRLSGSASTIKRLKDLFNMNYDVDLFRCKVQVDINTVAGLLKTYLRELPAPILGNNVYSDLKLILKQHGDTDKAGLAVKFRKYFETHEVSKIHYNCCFAIFKFLRKIIAHSETNRMILRNVCIVFVPTLNISLDILMAFLVDFDCIFKGAPPVPNEGREVIDLYIPNF